MKNHVAFKFLAVLLCALTLLASLLCILGIALLEQQDLYDRDLEQVLAEYRDNALGRKASNLVNVYASEKLGGCDPLLVEALWGTTEWEDAGLLGAKCAYTIRDSLGNVLESTFSDTADYAEEYTQTVLVHCLLQLEERDATYEGPAYGDPVIAPTMPPSDGEGDPGTEVQVWDPSQGRYRAFLFREAEERTSYQVTIHLEEGAWIQSILLDGVLVLWNQRSNLFFYLAGSLLLFAVGAVYLCCAAGRKPGSEELKPGGFNAIPLDLYTLLLTLALFVGVSVVSELGNYFDASYLVYGAFLLFAGFFGCLAFVGWCFAWAAQLKMGGGYWWRRSLTGIVLLQIPKLLKFLWGLVVKAFRLVRNLLRGIWAVLKGLALGVWHLLTVDLWNLVRKALQALARGIKGAWDWVFRTIHRFLSLLPLTWQWLLTGFVLMLSMFLCLRTGRTVWVLTGCAGVCLVILYGATAFGILLEAARDMGRGDLERKVEERFLVGSFRDFAGALNALAGAARLAAQKEMRSERMKSELITNVSHDIKTPLTSIINYVDLLQKPHTPEEEAEYLEVLSRKSEQLKKLIQDLMEMSKASTGNMAVNLERVDAVEAVNQALGEFSDKLAACGLQVVFQHPESPVYLTGDGRLVWRVLSNLLSNAVKYALPGTRLYVDLTRQAGKVTISLKNISAEPLNVDAEELMERFVRGNAARHTDGSGLGLNIAKSLMELQKGSLELTVDGDLFKASMALPEA